MVRTSRRQARSAVATITRLSDLCLDGPTAPEPAGLDPTLRVTIHNVVATASFGATFDLEHLAWKCYGEYTPRQAGEGKPFPGSSNGPRFILGRASLYPDPSQERCAHGGV